MSTHMKVLLVIAVAGMAGATQYEPTTQDPYYVAPTTQDPYYVAPPPPKKTREPTLEPTPEPTVEPTPEPTPEPTVEPTTDKPVACPYGYVGKEHSCYGENVNCCEYGLKCFSKNVYDGTAYCLKECKNDVYGAQYDWTCDVLSYY